MKEYIEREAAIEWVDDLVDTMSVCTSIDECLGMKSMKSRALGVLHDIPAADVVEVRHGRWNNGYEVQNCSECGYRGKRSYKYCPNCGAKMDGGADK